MPDRERGCLIIQPARKRWNESRRVDCAAGCGEMRFSANFIYLLKEISLKIFLPNARDHESRA